ncbi:MAG: glycosyltransferase family 1 protein [Chloroflexota bacterium]|nr:glycosyltransferase family 1 protein [Chloroflexota bacterium]
MRIAINGWFWNSPTTGSGQYTRRLVEALSALDTDLQIILVIPTGREQEAGGKEREMAYPASCLLHPVPCSRSNLGKVWFEQITFPRACRCLEADVAHVPYWASPLRPSIPTVVTIHDLIPLLLREYRGGPLVRFYTALVSTTARNAALVLTDSEASRRDIITHLGLPDERVRVVYLAADERYTPEPSPLVGESRGGGYDLPERYVLYLGGFDVRKNVATVLRTCRWAGPLIGEDCPLVIAGRLPERDTPFAPDPRRLAREQEVERFVRFIDSPAEADKPALYRGAVAFIYPSRYEGFGLPPLEALACGTPVVGSDVSSIPEVVGNAGVLLPPDDAEGMASALIQLATDDDFRAELGRRALIQAARFSWEHTARATLAAYWDVVD